MSNRPDMLLWLSDSRGIYIPRDFALSIDRVNVSGVSDEDWAILEAGPDHEYYWDTWADVEQNAVVTDEHGNKFTVYQNGDCWLIPEGMEYNEEKDTFAYPDDEEEDEQLELFE